MTNPKPKPRGEVLLMRKLMMAGAAALIARLRALLLLYWFT